MNLETKIFEIRDDATCIPVLATKMIGKTERQKKLLRRVGFDEYPLIQVTHIEDHQSSWYAFDWPNRTMNAAHREIQEKFDDLRDGQVIDVRVYLGEQAEPALTACV